MRAALQQHLSTRQKIDGIFSIKNALTVYAYKALRELQIAIPSEVSLLGYDDFELADILDPPITVVRQPVIAMATKATEILFQALTAEHVTPRKYTLQVELVPRGSCNEVVVQRRGNKRASVVQQNPA